MLATKYSNELREKALKLSDEIGNKRAAVECGISIKTLDYWRGVRKRNEIKKKLSKVIQPPKNDLKEELKDNNKITFQAAEEKPRIFKRGEIYYVNQMPTVGFEIATGRPAVIVSNQRINQRLNTIEVIFLTTKVKNLTPEHVIIKSSGAIATTICEQISTIDKRRIAEYIGTCTPEEMELIEKAMLHSLGLEKYVSDVMGDDQIVERIAKIKAERDAYRDLYDKLFDRVIGGGKS